MTRFRLSRKDVSKVLDPESAMGFGWPVAEDYEVVEEPQSGKEVIRYIGGYKYSTNKPLADGGFFLNLAKSWQSPKLRLSWVRAYGLPRCDQDDLGDPMPVDALVAEAKEAHRALTLYEAARAGDAEAVRSRIERRRVEREPESGPGEPSPFADVFVDGKEIQVVNLAEGKLSHKEVIRIAVYALEAMVNEKLAGLRFRFGANFGHPRPLAGTYMPSMGWAIPDLLTAAWFQFAMIMADSRPLKTCDFCGDLFAPSRSTQETCGKDRCRKKASRKKQKDRAARGSGQ